MKKFFSAYLFPALLLGFMTFTFVACGGDDEDDLPTPKETVVTIDEKGYANGNHTFVQIDDNNFYVDDIKYTFDEGYLSVTGYNKSFFEGEAKIIDALDFQGRHLIVRSIGKEAFRECGHLTSIKIPKSVTKIGSNAFSGCNHISAVYISDLTAWCKIKFEHYYSNPLGYDTHLYINGKKVTKLEIPNGVTSIGEWAFAGYSGLNSVTIPNSVKSIGEYAFSGCNGLTSINIPNSVTGIERFTFAYCNNLSTVTVENGVNYIDNYAFAGCRGLTSITIPESVTGIGDGIFQDCSNLKDVYCHAEEVPSTDYYSFHNFPLSQATLHVPAASIEAYKTTKPWSEFGRIVAIE